MKRLNCLAVVLLLFVSVSISTAQEKINWIPITDLEAAIAQEPRPVLIDVYTDWCGWCKRMDKTTFMDAKVVAFINANYYAIKFNAEQKESVSFLDNDFKFVASGRRGYHELAGALLSGQMSYPSYVFMTQEFKVLQVIKGYKTQEEFLPIITFLGKGLYKDQKWEDFIGTWNGD